jgi:hypothetical protein
LGLARALWLRCPGGRYPVAVRGHDRKAIFRRQSAPALPAPKARFNACPGQPPRNCHWPPSATIDRTGRRCPPGLLRRRALRSNPNGILSHSPRLAPQRLPWVIIPPTSSTPTGLRRMSPCPVCRRHTRASTPAAMTLARTGFQIGLNPSATFCQDAPTRSPSPRQNDEGAGGGERSRNLRKPSFMVRANQTMSQSHARLCVHLLLGT